MAQREARDDQHGRTGYRKGCRCDRCLEGNCEYFRGWREKNRERERSRSRRNRNAKLAKYRAAEQRRRAANLDRYREYNKTWKAKNADYVRERDRRTAALRQAEASSMAVRSGAIWGSREDALLASIPSNIAAAGALGRTPRAVKHRRAWLRKKGLLS